MKISKKGNPIAIAVALSLPISLSLASPAFSQRDEPCEAYTIESQTGYRYEEINNCPLTVIGTFGNRKWRVSIGKWEPAAYLYVGLNRSNGRSISLVDFDVAGTTSRPQYRFTNKDVTYVVSFQYSDPDTIRLQVYQNNRVLLNELLDRESDRVLR
jgi:hypothetical protein